MLGHAGKSQNKQMMVLHSQWHTGRISALPKKHPCLHEKGRGGNGGCDEWGDAKGVATPVGREVACTKGG